jgi:hypothetical protein
MAASVILDNLPKDAHAALETAGEVRDASGEVKGKGMKSLTITSKFMSLHGILAMP